MAAVTYGAAPVAAPSEERALPKKGWFARALGALIEARMRQAEREIAMHAHLLPYTFDEHGNRLVKSGKDEMPFGGW